MYKTCVLIPCYNEAQTIQNVVRKFKLMLPDADIIVYDNNSTDNTFELAEQAGAIVRKERRQGKGNVIRTMFRDIIADCYIMVDGDDTYSSENAPEMVRLVREENVDMVIGDRLSSTYFKENKRIFHNNGNRLVKFLINTIFNSQVKDILTGYRAFSYKFVKTLPIISKGFEIETEMTIHALDKNLIIHSIPIEYNNRPVGSESKLNTITDGIKVLGTIFNLFKEYKPFIFFNTCAFIFLIIGLIMFIPLFIDFLRTGLVLRMPTLIVSMFILIAAGISFVTGVILDAINRKYRYTYELLVNIFAKKNIN